MIFCYFPLLCIENLEDLKLVGVCKNQGLSEATGVVKHKSLRMISDERVISREIAELPLASLFYRKRVEKLNLIAA